MKFLTLLTCGHIGILKFVNGEEFCQQCFDEFDASCQEAFAEWDTKENKNV
jgi:hypothetical protein